MKVSEEELDEIVERVVSFVHARDRELCPIIETIDFVAGVKATVRFIIEEKQDIECIIATNRINIDFNIEKQ